MTVAILGSRSCLGDSCTKGDSGAGAERIAGGQAEADPFFHQILSEGWVQSLERAQTPPEDGRCSISGAQCWR
jgi:hypothetical protein